ncbi:MAG TPA: flavodoxin [Phycisphaerae bacterium]|nr:flavodoxin [Phycisphaerae bacterium]
MSDTLVVYYSRTGKTRLVAERLAGLLGADVEEIRETKSRAGAMGYLGGIKDAMFKCRARLADEHSASGRAAVVLGMPVWAASPPPAVREYLKCVDLGGCKVFAFCTYDGGGAASCLSKLAGVVGRELPATLELKKPAKDADLDAKIKDFAERIRAALK